jgi:hypothetical protein
LCNAHLGYGGLLQIRPSLTASISNGRLETFSHRVRLGLLLRDAAAANPFTWKNSRAYRWLRCKKKSLVRTLGAGTELGHGN